MTDNAPKHTPVMSPGPLDEYAPLAQKDALDLLRHFEQLHQEHDHVGACAFRLWAYLTSTYYKALLTQSPDLLRERDELRHKIKFLAVKSDDYAIKNGRLETNNARLRQALTKMVEMVQFARDYPEKLDGNREATALMDMILMMPINAVRAALAGTE